MIYDTVPVTALVDGKDLLAVRNLLRDNAGRWFTARRIAQLTGLPVENTQVHVRKIITELIEEHGAPIVACHAGFTWTSSESMLRHYRDSLLRREAGLRRRVMAVQRVKENVGEQDGYYGAGMEESY